jgi:hypothetical protein
MKNKINMFLMISGIFIVQLSAKQRRPWFNHYKEVEKSQEKYEHADKEARDLFKKLHSDIELKDLCREKKKYHNLASDKAVHILQGNPETKDKELAYKIWDYGVNYFDKKKNGDGSIQGDDYIRKIYTDAKDDEGLETYNKYIKLANDEKKLNDKLYGSYKKQREISKSLKEKLENNKQKLNESVMEVMDPFQ